MREKIYLELIVMFATEVSCRLKNLLALRNQHTLVSIETARMCTVKQLFAMNALEKSSWKQSVRIEKKHGAVGKQDHALKT